MKKYEAAFQLASSYRLQCNPASSCHLYFCLCPDCKCIFIQKEALGTDDRRTGLDCECRPSQKDLGTDNCRTGMHQYLSMGCMLLLGSATI